MFAGLSKDETKAGRTKATRHPFGCLVFPNTTERNYRTRRTCLTKCPPSTSRRTNQIPALVDLPLPSVPLIAIGCQPAPTLALAVRSRILPLASRISIETSEGLL